MNLIYQKSFFNDIKKIKDSRLKKKIKDTIISLEEASHFKDITGIKKLSGSENAYRIRIGSYRLGLFFENNQVFLSRFLKREDIYKAFP